MRTLVILIGFSRIKACVLRRHKRYLVTSMDFRPGTLSFPRHGDVIRLGQTPNGPLVNYTEDFKRAREFRDARLNQIVQAIAHIAGRYPCDEIFLASPHSIWLPLHEKLPPHLVDLIAKDLAGDFTGTPMELVLARFKAGAAAERARPIFKAKRMTGTKAVSPSPGRFRKIRENAAARLHPASSRKLMMASWNSVRRLGARMTA